MSFTILPVPLALMGAIAMSIVWSTPFVAILFPMVIIGIIASINCSKLGTSSNRQALFFLIYAATIAFMIYEVQAQDIPLMGIDWKGFSARAEYNLTSGKYGIALLFSDLTEDLYAKIISVIYQVFGVYPKMIHCYTFLFSQLLVYHFISFSAEFCEDNGDATAIPLLLSIIPVFVLHSVAFLREIPIALFFVMALKHYYRYLNSAAPKQLFMALSYGIIASIFHSGMIVVPIVFLVSLPFYSAKNTTLKANPIILIGVVIAMFVLFSSPIGQMMLSKLNTNDNVLQTISNHVTTDATTSYISSTPTSYSAMVLQTPIRTLLFELVPLPWHIRSLSTGLSWLLDGTVRLIFLYWEIRLIFHLNKIGTTPQKRVMLYAFVFIWFFFGILCGWGTTTYGTAIRHRVKALPAEVVMVYFSYVYQKKGRVI